MQLLLGGFVSMIFGAIGATLWTAVSYYLHRELGILAWGIGIACGAGMMLGSKHRAAIPGGIVAAVIAVAAIGIGKYGVAYFTTQKLATSQTVDEDVAKSFLADEIEQQMVEANKPLTKNGDDTAPEAVEAAEKRWKSMSKSDRDKYIADTATTLRGVSQLAGGQTTMLLFKNSFDLFDVLWAGLATFFAFRIGSGKADAA